MTGTRPFSVTWVVLSVLIYTAAEIVLGIFVGPLVAGRFVTPMVDIRVMMMLHLASFFVGGLVVGVISPGVRLLEPAVGAFVAVVLVFLMTFFLPHTFAFFLGTKIVVSGSIAFGCALAGAYAGERLVGNLDEPNARAVRLRSQLWRR